MRNNRNLEPQFLQLDLNSILDLRSVPPERISLIFAIGYPTRFSSFDTKFNETDDAAIGLDVTSRWVKLYLEQVSPSVWDKDCRVSLQVHHRYHVDIGDPDGFSGTPVFFLYQDNSKQAYLGFAGIIAEANMAGRVSMYEAVHIRQILAGIK